MTETQKAITYHNPSGEPGVIVIDAAAAAKYAIGLKKAGYTDIDILDSVPRL